VRAHSEQLRPDEAPDTIRPIEFQTENGFSILRQWEIDQVPPPATGSYSFLVHNPESQPREIIVRIKDHLVIYIALRTRHRVLARCSFWPACAERHLADYLWENDDYPPDNQIEINCLDPTDIMSALHWEVT
jgi:hypothetical protein